MNSKSHYLSDHRLIVQFVRDTATVDLMIALRQGEIDSGWIKPDTNTLAVLDTQDVGMTPKELGTYIDWMKKNLAPLAGSKTAVVVSSPILAALNVIISELASDVRDVKLFSTIGAAAKWLKVPVAAIVKAVPETESYHLD